MDDREYERQVRIEIELGKAIPSKEDLRLHERGLAMTPDALQQPFDRVWRWNITVSEPGSKAAPSEGSGHWSSLGAVIAHLRQEVFIAFAKGLAVERIPVAPRFARVIGTGIEPSSQELAAGVAGVLGLAPTTEPGTVRLLVMLAIVVHGHYDNPLADVEATTVGYTLTPRVIEPLRPDELRAASSELGFDPNLELEETLGDLACDLLIHMGFKVW
jgi:hypothetical protein